VNTRILSGAPGVDLANWNIPPLSSMNAAARIVRLIYEWFVFPCGSVAAGEAATTRREQPHALRRSTR
jgi:hypothetical protein